MPTITQGSQQTVNLAADQAVLVSTADLAYVDLVAGAPGSPYDSRRIRAGVPQQFGPYGVPAVLRVRAVQGDAGQEAVTSSTAVVGAWDLASSSTWRTLPAGALARLIVQGGASGGTYAYSLRNAALTVSAEPAASVAAGATDVAAIYVDDAIEIQVAVTGTITVEIR